MTGSATPQEAKAFYDRFSLEMGADDWRRDNGRHLRIRYELAQLLGAPRGLRVLDIGCGAGVLTSGLCRYGTVTGVDLSGPAIELAAELEPRARFLTGRVQELDLGSGFDLVTMFDILEHVPTDERPALFALLDSLLGPGGWLVLTTPHPSYTRWLQQHRPDLLQVIDEPVRPEELITLAGRHQLELVDYRAYDVDVPGARQYQLLAFTRDEGRARSLPAGGQLRRLGARLAALPVGPLPKMWRLAHAIRLLRIRRFAAARWLLGRGALPAHSER